MENAGHVLEVVHNVYARANDTSTDATEETRPPVFKVVGISLAIASGAFIGTSFVLKKVGLLKANEKYQEVAGEGYGYLKNFYWWSGMILMIVGEICNFVAYAFTDAILVTPLGALSVVITTVLSAIFLKERLSMVGKVACFLCIVGSVVIVMNAPEESSVANIQEMQKFVITPGFLSYTGVILVGSAITAFYAGPRWGKKNMLVYISICSWVGGLSVVATQGLGAAIVAQIQGTSGGQFTHWFIYVLLVFVIGTLLTEIIFLNVSLLVSVPRIAVLLIPTIESTEFVQCGHGHADLLCVLY
jgi:magnesium transporter